MRKEFLLAGFSVFAIVGMLFAMFPQDSQAIPPFARKYKTACTTCHWGTFPKLNAFGNAFFNNGLRMPGGGDEVFIKDEPVEMGASAWSKLFPKAVWPGEIPGLPPIGFKMVTNFTVTQERPQSARGSSPRSPERENDTEFRGIDDIEVLLGGTFGETISFFAAGPISEVERAHVNYTPFIFGEQGLFNVRVGKLDIRGAPISNHIRMTDFGYIMSVMPQISAGNFFGFHPNQQGIEFWGSKNGPGGKGGLEWAIGIVNGSTGDGEAWFAGAGDMGTILENVTAGARNGGPGAGETNNHKDWYAMVSYKLWGMGVLGEESVDDSLVAKENWQDNSVRVKGYYYSGVTGAFIDNPAVAGNFGNPLNGNDGIGVWDPDANRFKRFGVLVDAYWWNFNFMAAASFLEDDISGTITYAATTFGATKPQETGSNFDTSIYTGEIQWVALPWLIQTGRIENVNPDYEVRDLKSFTKYTLDTTVVLRANMKLKAAANFSNYPDADSDGTPAIDLGNRLMDTTYQLGLDVCF